MRKKDLIFLTAPIGEVLIHIKFFTTYRQAVSSIILIVTNFLISVLLYKLFRYLFSKFSSANKIVISSISVLFLLDWMWKYFIEKTGFECNIIGTFFRVKRSDNINQMAILSYFGTELNSILIISFKILLLAAFAFFLFKVKDTDLKIGFILVTAAQISNTLDSIVRGYTLDSFNYFKLLCYDIKDYYAGTGIILIVYVIMVREIENDKKRQEQLKKETQ